jgi:hypothetical protein
MRFGHLRDKFGEQVRFGSPVDHLVCGELDLTEHQPLRAEHERAFLFAVVNRTSSVADC